MSEDEPVDLELVAFRNEETGGVDYQHKFPWGLLLIRVSPEGTLLDLCVATIDEIRRLEPSKLPSMGGKDTP